MKSKEKKMWLYTSFSQRCIYSEQLNAERANITAELEHMEKGSKRIISKLERELITETQ